MRSTSDHGVRAILFVYFMAGWLSVAHGQDARPADVSNSSPAGASAVDFAMIFSRRVTIPDDVEERAGEVKWKATNLLEKDAPRFRHAHPQAGDFALYYVSHAYEPTVGTRRLVGTGDYLMLEIVCPERESANDNDEPLWMGDSKLAWVRVYGAATHRDAFDPKKSSLAFRGLFFNVGRAEFPIFMPGSHLRSCENDTISIHDVAYFRDYTAFAAKTNKNGEGRDDRLTWTKLEQSKDKGCGVGATLAARMGLYRHGRPGRRR